MLCDQCQNLPGDVRRTIEPNLSEQGRLDRLREYLCDHCGELLPPRDPTDRFLRSLSRLAAFGLAAGGSPILKR